MKRTASAPRVASRFTSLREAMFEDWTPDREENPDGLRDILAGNTKRKALRNLVDPEGKYDHLRAALPGDDPSKTAFDYHENPYSVKMPRELGALLRDPEVTGEMRRRVADAYASLESREGAKVSPSLDRVPPPKKPRQY